MFWGTGPGPSVLSGRMHSPIRVPRCAGRGAVLFSVLAVTSAVTFGCKGSAEPDPDPDAGLNVDAGPNVDTITVQGTATYDYVPVTTTPAVTLAFADASARPVRGAIVQVRRGAVVIATTNTDEQGQYMLEFQAAPEGLEVAVLSETTLPPIRVEDNTNGDAVWGMVRPLAEAENGTLDLHATHGWNGTSFDAGTRVAAPFAILDTIYATAQAFRAVRTVTFQPLKVNWSPDNVPEAGDHANGFIGTSSFRRADREIYVLGKDGVDTDEFDAGVLAHEWTHYFEDQLGRVDGLGGDHAPGAVLDPRLSFDEGLADAMAGLTLGVPVYADTAWAGSTLTGFSLDVETPPTPTDDTTPGPFSEFSVMRIVYDLFDSGASEAHDTVALGLGPLYDALAGPHRTTDALGTIGSFIAGLKAQPGVNAADVDTLLAFYDIGPITSDFGAGDPDLAAMYTNVTVPFTGTHDLVGGQDANRRAQNQYFVFMGTGATLTVSAGHASEDVGISLYRTGQLVASADAWLDGGTESLSAPTVSGATYVLTLTGFRGAPGSYTVDLTIAP